MLDAFVPMYRMHTQTFNNVLDGFKETDVKTRLNGRTNHVLWMVGNLVNCRYWTANLLGVKDKDPHDDLFKDAKALNESYNYPPLDVLKKEWHVISPKLFQKLISATDEELQKPFDIGMGTEQIMDNVVVNYVAMGIDREDYLLGQLGLMRKALGYEGIKYDIDASLAY